jgi:hypothetical protein
MLFDLNIYIHSPICDTENEVAMITSFEFLYKKVYRV